MGKATQGVVLSDQFTSVQQILDYPDDLIPINRMNKWKLHVCVTRKNLKMLYGLEAVQIAGKLYYSREGMIEAAWDVWNNPRKRFALLLQIAEKLWGKRELSPMQRQYAKK